MKRFMLIALAAMSLTACSTVELAAPPAPVISTSATVADEKAYAQALNAYNAAASSYLASHTLLPPDVKARAKVTLQTAKRALDAARDALAAANAPNFAAQLALAIKATDQAVAILPKKG